MGFDSSPIPNCFPETLLQIFHTTLCWTLCSCLSPSPSLHHPPTHPNRRSFLPLCTDHLLIIFATPRFGRYKFFCFWRSKEVDLRGQRGLGVVAFWWFCLVFCDCLQPGCRCGHHSLPSGRCMPLGRQKRGEMAVVSWGPKSTYPHTDLLCDEV
jgi:hypothetical protein